MQAAVATGARFVVLDRPNPVGGARRAGPMLQPGVHLRRRARSRSSSSTAMTVGELARFFDAEFLPADAGGPAGDLTVVAVTRVEPSSRRSPTPGCRG